MPDVEGVLSYTDIMTSARLAEYARQLEALGYRELWVPDLMGRETFVTAGFLLANTTRLPAWRAASRAFTAATHCRPLRPLAHYPSSMAIASASGSA